MEKFTRMHNKKIITNKPKINKSYYGPRVAVLGDSITYDGGYIKELQRLCPSLIFHNYGIPGETSTQIAKRVQFNNGDLRRKILALEEYDQLIILAGINNVYEPVRVISDLKKIYKKAKTIKSHPVRVIAVTLSHGGSIKDGHQKSNDSPIK